MAAERSIVLDPFCLRQFTDPTYTGTKVNYDTETFEARINELFDSGAAPLVDGYAPFCKHLFIENFAGVEGNTVKITPENESLVKSAYEARTEKELAVLVRFFPRGAVPAPPARYLDIILYSREQIRKENAAMGKDSKSGL